MKRKYIAGILLLCAAILPAFWVFHFHIPHCAAQSGPASQSTAQSAALDGTEYTLFPGLDEAAITAITIRTPDCHFEFLRKDSQFVSVNGQQADHEIFLTLLEQIAGLPVDHHSAFSPQTDELLLTLIVNTHEKQHTAHFYEGGQNGEFTRIVSGTADAPQYRQTGGWRVGTLMMTCEGTRIQDAHGNEMPFKTP